MLIFFYTLISHTYSKLPTSACAVKPLFTTQATQTCRFLELGGDLEEKRVLDAGAWSLARFIALVDTEGLFMKKQSALEAAFCGENFVKCYIWLAQSKAVNGDATFFRARPKLHIFHHIALNLRTGTFNPKSVSCFSDEDYVRRICSIASGCHHGGILQKLMRRVFAVCFVESKL